MIRKWACKLDEKAEKEFSVLWTALPFASVRIAMCNVNSSWIFTPSTPSGEEVVTAYLLPIQLNIDRAIAATECIEGAADIEEM